MTHMEKIVIIGIVGFVFMMMTLSFLNQTFGWYRLS